ncbi:MAG: hypothetical protein DHS20C11_14470 [Lysobacteraceae bacterium]|nr:MAG: hypothetical protein DHS20C11_14470 [Xanthomonadaceae bacterium]
MEIKPTALSSGSKLGRFLILDAVGQGGSGAVYSAYDPKLDRKVAIKVLPRGSREDALRLAREARSLAQLSHPNVLAVFEVDEDQGVSYLVTELVTGSDLAQWLKSAHPWAEVLELFMDAGEGLQAAHAVGLVHRDFKPANVLIGDDGRVRVADFGLARPADTSTPTARTAPLSGDNVRLTETGTLFGTPAYMAPEQWRGELADARSDQFAFASALYEALYREPAFSGQGGDARLQSMGEGPMEPVDRRRVPHAVHQVLEKALAYDPEQRFEDMPALLSALQKASTLRRRQRTAVAGVAAAVLIGMVVANFSQPDKCLPPAGFGVAWQESARQQIRTAFSATGLPYADQAATQLFAIVDNYMDGWENAFVSACEATHVTNEQSLDLLDRRMVCLDSRRSQLDELAELMKTADANVVRRSAQAAGALPDLAQCADRTALLSRNPLPAEASAREEMEWLDRIISRGQVMHDAGQYQQADTMLTEHRDRAIEQPFLPTHARYRVLAGQVASRLDQLDRAIDDLKQGRFLAMLGGDMDLAMLANAEWLWNAGYLQADYETGEELAIVARELMQRASLGNVSQAAFHNAFGSMRQTQENFSEAIAELELAVDLYRQAFGDPSYKLGATLYNLANAQRQHGLTEQAAENYGRAMNTFSAAIGDQHPVNAILLGGVGGFLHEQGDLEGARESLLKALKVAELNYGPDHTETAIVLQNLGTLSNTEGKSADAVAYLSRALAILENSPAPDAVWVEESRVPLAQAMIDSGDPQGALDMLSRASATLGEEQHLTAAQLAYQRARALHALGAERAVVESELQESERLAALTEERRTVDGLHINIANFRSQMDSKQSP